MTDNGLDKQDLRCCDIGDMRFKKRAKTQKKSVGLVKEKRVLVNPWVTVVRSLFPLLIFF